MYYIMLYIYTHIYIYQSFPYWGIGVIPLLAKNLLTHPAPGTISPPPKVSSPPLNKNFHVINK